MGAEEQVALGQRLQIGPDRHLGHAELFAQRANGDVSGGRKTLENDLPALGNGERTFHMLAL